MLEASQLDVLFNPGTPLENHALRDLSLRIAPGEFVTAIGANGSGKSTLLSALAGDVRPISGRVGVAGRDVTGQSAAARARHLGRVFQDPRAGTSEGLTILENLAVAARRGRARTLRPGARKREIAQWRSRLADLGLGLENRLDDKVELLSGGQRQALSLLMACLVPNRALLLDEHTAALDPAAATDVLLLTDRLAARSKLTVLMVTHSMTQALAHGTRTVMLNEGRIVCDLHADRRRSMAAEDLLELFRQVRGCTRDDALTELNRG